MSKTIATTLIRAYQATNGLKDGLLITVFGYSYQCKHSPSCSVYALQQIEQHGTIWGLIKAFQRLITCW